MAQRRRIVKRRLILGSAALIAALFVWSALQLPPPRLRAGRAWPVLADVTVVNPGGDRRAHQTVTLRDGVIESIRDTPQDTPARPAERLYGGRFVLPGLIDLDVRRLPEASHLLRMDGIRFLAGGVTTVRVVGNFAGDLRVLQGEIAAGDYPWPRLLACGRALVGTPSRCDSARLVASPADAAAAVDQTVAAGGSCVGLDRSLDPAVAAAIVAAADARRVPLAGDLPAGVRLPPTANISLRLIGLTQPRAPAADVRDWLRSWSAWQPADVAALAASLRGTQASITTNLMRWSGLPCAPPAPGETAPLGVFQPRFVREIEWPDRRAAACAPTSDGAALTVEQRLAAARYMAEAAVVLHRAGVAIHPGSGLPAPDVDGAHALWLELATLVHAGLTPEQAWQSATRDAGATLGIPGLGTVAPGAPADLLVFRDDPTRDLRGLETLEAVITQGRAYPAYKFTRYSLEYARYFEHRPYDIASMLVARLRRWWNGDSAFACDPL